MKTIVRGIVYVAWMTAAVLVLAQPFVAYMDTLELDMVDLLVHAVVGFLLVFAGTEVIEWLKRRWSDGE